MNRGRSYLTSVSLMAAGFTFIAPAIAQEVGGLTATVGIRQGLEVSDNFDLVDPAESGARSVTRLSFGLSSVTQSSSLALSASGAIELGDLEDTGFNDPSVGFQYNLNRKNSRLSVRANHTRSDVNALNTVTTNTFISILEGFSEQVFVGEGTRERTTGNLTFETGIDAPFGVTLETAYNFVDFSDTNDPDLFQTETITVGGNLRFRVNGQLTFNLGGSVQTYDALDTVRTSRENTSVYARAVYQLRPDLAARAELNYTNNETSTAFGNTTEDGAGGSFGLTKNLRNGTIGFEFDSRITTDGRRDSLSLSRELDFKDGALAFSVGVVQTETSDLEPLFNVAYTKDLRRGQVTLGLSQRASIDDEDNTVINSSLNARYDARINANSSWGMSARLADTNSLDLPDDTRRIDLGLDYRYDVTRDWDLVANYTYSRAEQSGEDDRSSNTLSLSIQRDFQFRP